MEAITNNKEMYKHTPFVFVLRNDDVITAMLMAHHHEEKGEELMQLFG